MTTSTGFIKEREQILISSRSCSEFVTGRINLRAARDNRLEGFFRLSAAKSEALAGASETGACFGRNECRTNGGPPLPPDCTQLLPCRARVSVSAGPFE